MSVNTFNPYDVPQSSSNWTVARRIIDPFAPHEQTQPNLTVMIDQGYLLKGVNLIETPPQVVEFPLFGPGDFRIDRVLLRLEDGVAHSIAGVVNDPTAPAILPGHLPIARVFRLRSATAITNDVITDERVLWGTVQTSPPEAVAGRLVVPYDKNTTSQTVFFNKWVRVKFEQEQLWGMDHTLDGPGIVGLRVKTSGVYSINGSVAVRYVSGTPQNPVKSMIARARITINNVARKSANAFSATDHTRVHPVAQVHDLLPLQAKDTISLEMQCDPVDSKIYEPEPDDPDDPNAANLTSTALTAFFVGR